MPYKDKDARNARSRARHQELKEQDPEWVAKRKARLAEDFQKRKARDDQYLAKRAEDSRRWYGLYGKDNARARKGYVSQEEYLMACDTNRKARAEYMKAWNQTEKGKRNRVSQNLKKGRILDIDAYDAAYDAQGGRCAICKAERERYAKNRLCVDHDHTTGQFRGLLCTRCNTSIGMIADNQETLHEAIRYLQKIE